MLSNARIYQLVTLSNHPPLPAAQKLDAELAPCQIEGVEFDSEDVAAEAFVQHVEEMAEEGVTKIHRRINSNRRDMTANDIDAIYRPFYGCRRVF